MGIPQTAPMPLAALHWAMDELSRRPSAFDAHSADLGRTWAASATACVDFDLPGGRFVASRAGHYMFMASAGSNVCLTLTRNSADVAEPLDSAPSLLVAALQLKPGDAVGLRVGLRPGDLADVATPVRWRGSRL